MKIIKFGLSLGIFLFVFSASANQVTGQKKIFIFLKNPVQDNSVSIHFNNGIKGISEGPVENAVPENIESKFNLLFNRKSGSKQVLTVICPQSGVVKLEAFDLFGRRFGTLFNAYSQGEVITIDENPAWKKLTHFRGITYLILSVDGKTVFKKLMPKVE